MGWLSSKAKELGLLLIPIMRSNVAPFERPSLTISLSEISLRRFRDYSQMIEIPDRPSVFDSDEEMDHPINTEEVQYGPDDDADHEASHEELPIRFLPYTSIRQIQELYKATESAAKSKDAVSDALMAPDIK
ncbi:hypothetical protein ACLOJK_018879 [Asimina triloba]